MNLMKTPEPPAWELAPAPESVSHVQLKDSYGIFVDGEFVESSGGQFATINPATENTVAMIAESSAADVDRAVQAARVAFDERWKRMPARDRGKFVFRLARMIQEKSRELAVIESMDGGKPIRESRDVDVPLAAAHFFYHARFPIVRLVPWESSAKSSRGIFRC
jgi:aldehyde dehydrogenase (NAD+)